MAAAWRILGLTCGAVFVVSLDATVVVAIFPVLRRQFSEFDPLALSWVLNAYTLTYATLLIPFGRWADLNGRRKAFLLGFIVFTGASFLCAFAPGPLSLIAFRVGQAIGAAMLTPASLSLVLDAAPPETRAVVVGAWGAIGALASAIGPAFGSWLTEVISWRAVFWINVPLGILVYYRAGKGLPESRKPMSKVGPDWVGTGMLIIGIGLIILGLLTEWGSAGITLRSILLVFSGVASLGAYFAWASHTPDPVLDLALFTNSNFRNANLATLVFGSAFGLMFFSSFLFLTEIWHLPQKTAGLASIPGPLAVIPVAFLTGRLSSQIGYRTFIMAGGLIYATGQLWYLTHVGPRPDYAASWLPGQLLSGIAIGLTLPALTAASAAALPQVALGSGNAVNATLRQLGAVIGVAIGAIVVGQTGAELFQFKTVFLILAAGGVLTALLAVRLHPQAPVTFES